ncbi:unnamed protein product, partial [Musa acuminata subsp. burmannicoides]
QAFASSLILSLSHHHHIYEYTTITGLLTSFTVSRSHSPRISTAGVRRSRSGVLPLVGSPAAEVHGLPERVFRQLPPLLVAPSAKIANHPEPRGGGSGGDSCCGDGGEVAAGLDALVGLTLHRRHARCHPYTVQIPHPFYHNFGPRLSPFTSVLLPTCCGRAPKMNLRKVSC